MKSACVVIFILLTLLSVGAVAQGPNTLSYQGVLADASGVVVGDGDYSMTFRLYSVESGGSPLWQETQIITVSKGIFNAVLGSVTSLALPFNVQYWLGISVAGEIELTPRIALTSSAYSISSRALVGTSNMVPSSGSAGIGTLSPLEKLDVAGAVRLGTTGASNAGTIRWNGSDFEGYDGASWQSFTATGEGLPTGTPGQTLRHTGTTWAASGNLYNDNSKVGIGTTAPVEKLDVAGNIRGYTLRAGSSSVSGSVEAYGNGIVSGLLDSNQEGGYLLLYDESGNNIIAINPSTSGGILRINRNETQSGLSVEGNYNGTESTRMLIRGNSLCQFDMSETGNLSVALPVDAIGSSELQNEPGVTSYTHGISNIPIGSTYANLGSISITVPASGYVLVTATATTQISHEAGTESLFRFGISTEPDTIPDDYLQILGFPAASAEGFYHHPLSFHRLFRATSQGTYTYYLIARKGFGYLAWAREIHMTCIYFPTAYGAIATTSSGSAGDGTDSGLEGGESLTCVAAQRAASEAANLARIERELAEMRERIRELEQEEKR